MTNLLLLYILLTVTNVMLQTIKSLCTIKCGKLVASIVNAVAYGLYIYVMFYTCADGIPLWGKALITALANLVGVYVSTSIFNKIFTKENLWRVEVTVPHKEGDTLNAKLTECDMSYSLVPLSNDAYSSFIVYCKDKKDSKALKEILPVTAKYNITETTKAL